MNEEKQSDRAIGEIFAIPGRFLSNIFDPCSPNARMYLTYSYHAFCCGAKAMDAEWQQHIDWVNENIICLPKATKTYTQQQLIAMDVVGIYARTTVERVGGRCENGP